MAQCLTWLLSMGLFAPWRNLSIFMTFKTLCWSKYQCNRIQTKSHSLIFPEESIGKGFRILSLLKKKFYLISKGVKILRSLFTEQRGYSYRTVWREVQIHLQSWKQMSLTHNILHQHDLQQWSARAEWPDSTPSLFERYCQTSTLRRCNLYLFN